MEELIEELIIFDDEPNVLNTLSNKIKRNVGAKPKTSNEPDQVNEIIARSNTPMVVAFDFDLHRISNKTGLEFLIEIDENLNDNILVKVLFSKGIIEKEKKDYCDENGIVVYEKNIKELPNKLIKLVQHKMTSDSLAIEKATTEIIKYERSADEIWFDLKLRFKRELISSLSEIENKNARFNLNMSDSISIDELIDHIKKETPLGLKKIESWVKSYFRRNKK